VDRVDNVATCQSFSEFGADGCLLYLLTFPTCVCADHSSAVSSDHNSTSRYTRTVQVRPRSIHLSDCFRQQNLARLANLPKGLYILLALIAFFLATF